MKVDEHKLDKQFDDNQESILEDFDIANAERVNLQQKKVNISMPLWMIEGLDKEASRLGVARQAIIKSWLANKLKE
jgi:predicted DNA binding CopG/RHH family protein